MTSDPPFRRRWPWLGADLQTVRNVLPFRLAGIPPGSGERFEIALGDGSGDRLVARYHAAREPAPAVVLVPGLTGCEGSRHVLQAAGAFLAAGAAVVRLNLRGSAPGRSLARGHYHMDRVGDLADACLAVAELDAGIRERGIAILGYSLGGALALRLAASPGLPPAVRAVVAVSAPVDLAATADRIARPRNRPYERWLLARLREESEPVWRARAARGAEAPCSARATSATSTMRSPQGEAGFRDAADYYARCSPGRTIGALRVPTLVLHADDDPWVPPPDLAARPPLEIVVTRGGGHVGFHGKGSRLPWYVGTAARFIRASTSTRARVRRVSGGHAAFSGVEGGERFRARGVDRDDLVETADLEDFADRIGHGAERELGVPARQGLGGHQHGAKPGTADIAEILAVDQHGAVGLVDRRPDRLLELGDVRAVDTPAHLGGQDALLTFRRHIHGLRLQAACGVYTTIFSLRCRARSRAMASGSVGRRGRSRARPYRTGASVHRHRHRHGEGGLDLPYRAGDLPAQQIQLADLADPLGGRIQLGTG